MKSKNYLNIALACVGARCHAICEESLKRAQYHIDTVLATKDSSSSIYLHLYKRLGAKKIASELQGYDAIFFIASYDDEDSVSRCLEAGLELIDEHICSCVFLGENEATLESCVPCVVIKEDYLCHTIAKLFSACNLDGAKESEISLVLDLSKECTSIFKWELPMKAFSSDWEKRLDNVDLYGATQVLAIIKSKETLPLDKYDELSFALMSRLGEGIDISFKTIQDEKLRKTAVLSIYSGYPKMDMELDKTNYTKN